MPASKKSRSRPAPAPSKPPPAVLEKFREILSPQDIIEAAVRLGAIERQRKVDFPALVEATVCAMVPIPGTQTTAFANYISLTGQQIAPSAFYDRFDPEFGEVMREIAIRAVDLVRELEPEESITKEFGTLLREFTDVRIADSTCHLLKRLAKDWAPSTNKKRPAGVKYHAVVSLRDGLPVADDLTAQRTHDNAAFPEYTMLPGTLSLFDLGYIDVLRFIEAIEAGAGFLTRLKSNHNPVVVRVHVGGGNRVKARGMRLDDALASGDLVDEKGILDVDVRLEHRDRSAIARAVAVTSPDGERHWYLTTVARETLNPTEVADAYRLRWYIELIFKQLKSGLGFDCILAWRPGAVIALIYAKIVALSLARLLSLAAAETEGTRAQTRLAIVLALARCAPLLLSYSMSRRGVTVAQLEERILIIAKITARSRNRRRDRVRRQREQALGMVA